MQAAVFLFLGECFLFGEGLNTRNKRSIDLSLSQPDGCQLSSIRNGHAPARCLAYSLTHWAYFGLHPPPAAACVRPSSEGALRQTRRLCFSR